MIRRVNDMKLEEFLTEHEGWLFCLWFSYGSIPCEHFRPEFEALRAACSDAILFVDIDVDEHPEYTAHRNVTAVPTMVCYLGGEERKRFEGPYSRERLLQDITALVNKRRRKK